MRSVLRSSVAAAAVIVVGLAGPAMAQSAAETSVRMGQLEDEMRQLTGQVEDLTNQVRQLKTQLAVNAGGAAAPAAPGAPKLKKQSAIQQPAPALAPAVSDGQSDIQVSDANAGTPASNRGVEQIQDTAPAAQGGDQVFMKTVTNADGSTAQVPVHKAPGAKILGALAGSSAAQPGDGGFQGQVLVAPGQQEPGADAAILQSAPAQGDATAAAGDAIDQTGVQPVSLNADTPDALYERSNESLLRRQFGDAEAGFRTFLQKYPDHALAGNAQYWLGETYFAQNDFRQAAQAFLQGYRKYPDSRRAADSLLKLGISLNRLGQAQQACAAFASVDANYPKAVDARRRAQAEAKRASCPA